jgi:glutamate racemase
LLKKYLLPMVDKNIDTLVLGCTHYPYLIDLINDILPKKISIVEPSKAIAKRVQSLIAGADLSDNSDIENKFYTTANVDVMTRFLKNEGLENPDVQCLRFTA